MHEGMAHAPDLLDAGKSQSLQISGLFKSFLLRPYVIMLIFNGLEWLPGILAGQQ
jgi:hypothetical protein